MTGAFFRRRQRARSQKDAVADTDISRRFNELRNEIRRELLDDRAKVIDWWLRATAIFLTLLGIVAAVAGFFTLTEVREYAEKAEKLVGEIEERNERSKLLTAKDVNDNPNEVRRVTRVSRRIQRRLRFPRRLLPLPCFNDKETSKKPLKSGAPSPMSWMKPTRRPELGRGFLLAISFMIKEMISKQR